MLIASPWWKRGNTASLLLQRQLLDSQARKQFLGSELQIAFKKWKFTLAIDLFSKCIIKRSWSSRHTHQFLPGTPSVEEHTRVLTLPAGSLCLTPPLFTHPSRETFNKFHGYLWLKGSIKAQLFWLPCMFHLLKSESYGEYGHWICCCSDVFLWKCLLSSDRMNSFQTCLQVNHQPWGYLRLCT